MLSLQQKLLPVDSCLDFHVVCGIVGTLRASELVIAQLPKVGVQLMQGLGHGLGGVRRLAHLLLRSDEHVGRVCGLGLVGERILHLPLLPDGLQLLINLEVLEAHILGLRQQSLLCRRHGLANQRIFESLLFVRAVLLRVAGFVALNDINWLFNGLVMRDFIHGLH